MSPELVLVDRELREAALEELPRVEPFDFLRFTTEPRRHSDLARFDFLAGYGEVETFERVPPVWVAAPMYAVAALAKVIVVDTIVLLVIVTAVALLQVG